MPEEAGPKLELLLVIRLDRDLAFLAVEKDEVATRLESVGLRARTVTFFRLCFVCGISPQSLLEQEDVDFLHAEIASQIADRRNSVSISLQSLGKHELVNFTQAESASNLLESRPFAGVRLGWA